MHKITIATYRRCGDASRRAKKEGGFYTWDVKLGRYVVYKVVHQPVPDYFWA